MPLRKRHACAVCGAEVGLSPQTQAPTDISKKAQGPMASAGFSPRTADPPPQSFHSKDVTQAINLQETQVGFRVTFQRASLRQQARMKGGKDKTRSEDAPQRWGENTTVLTLVSPPGHLWSPQTLTGEMFLRTLEVVSAWFRFRFQGPRREGIWWSRSGKGAQVWLSWERCCACGPHIWVWRGA